MTTSLAERPATAPATPGAALAERPVDEVAAAARLVGALVDTLSTPIEATHRGIAGRVFGVLGPVALPARLVHDAVSTVAYGSARVGGRAAGAVAGAALGLTARGVERRPVSAHPLGAQALSFASGLLGDWMVGRTDDLIVRLSVSQHGRPLGSRPDEVLAALAADGPPTDRLVVFVHGLAETNAAWGWWSTAPDGSPVPTYAERLADVGWTPIEVSYNTGDPVTTSGARLCDLVEALAAGWPGGPPEIALVGHSMGGLVVGSAIEMGLVDEMAWTDRVAHVVTLGTPHGGSWLARAAHAGSAASSRRPEAHGLAAILELRSPGIRDLTRGWRPADELLVLPDLLPHAQHGFVGSSLRPPFDRLVGDGLVHARSATAPGRRSSGSNVVVRVHPGVGHIRLVHHPAVADDLVGWLGPRPPS